MNSISVFQEFESLVSEILSAEGFGIEGKEVRGPDSGRSVDLIVKWNNQSYICEIKAYRTRRAQVSLIFSAASMLHMMSDEFMLPGILIVSSKIDSKVRIKIKETFNIHVFDIEDIYLWGAKAGGLSDRLAALLSIDSLEVESFEGKSVEGILNSTESSLDASLVAYNDNTASHGTALIDELKKIEPGRESWSGYEGLCIRILDFLFKDQLQGWYKQLTSADGINRYDYVCKISGTNDFWSFLNNHLRSRYIVFEFKNYSKKITQFQIITTEKYLLENALRKVAIIICRKGGDGNSEKMIQGAMRESGKLIMIINDDDLIKMVNQRIEGHDASDHLGLLADNFLLQLPR